VDVQFDMRHVPVIVATMKGALSDHEFDAYLVRLTKELNVRPNVVFILDAREAGTGTLGQLQRQAQWMKEQRAAIARSLGTVFVIDRPVVRFALSTVLAIAPLPGKFTVTATLSEAVAWAMARLRTVGAEASPGLRELA